MNRSDRPSALRPANWSFAAKATVIPSVGLVVMGLVLALLVSGTVRTIQLASVQSDFELLGEAQSRRVAQIIVRQVSLLNSLAQGQVVIEHARERIQPPADDDATAPAEDSADLDEQIDFFLRRFPQFTDIIIVDFRGEMIATNRVEDMAMTDFSNEAWFDFVISSVSGRMYLNDQRVFDPGISASGMQVQGVEIALPVLDTLDQPIGAVYAVWDLSASPELTAGVQAGRVTILNRDGVTMADSAEVSLGQQGLSEELVAAFQAERVGSVLGSDEQGVQTIFGYSSLVGLTQLPEFEQTAGFAFDVPAPIRALGWTVIASRDAGEALAGIDVLVRRILVILVAGSGTVILLAFLFARSLVAPLGRLTEAARNIGAGQLDTPIPYSGGDEIGQLADVLRVMVTRLVRRLDQLRGATEVTHASQASLVLDEMLQGVVQVITSQLGFPQARVYLLDEQDAQRLVLRAYAGNGDSTAVEGQRHVITNEPNVIGRAARLMSPQLGGDFAALVPGGSELGVPLQSANDMLGVLYVSSAESDELDEDDVGVMALLADQISTSVQNARLFEQSEASLRDIEALNRRLTREGWTDYLEEQDQLRFALSPQDEPERWPASLSEAAGSGVTVASPVVSDDEQAVLAVPVLLRGEVIGTLGVKQVAGHEWSDEEIRLVQAVAERLALIAEGIRLLDSADRKAQREQLVSSVSARLQRATEVDTLLQTALDELGGALGSSNVSLRIGTPPGATDADGADGDADVGDESPDGQGVT